MRAGDDLKNGIYWKKRFAALEHEQHKKDEAYIKDLGQQFRMASARMEADIEKWYYRLAENNDITYTAAKKLLKANELEEFHWTVEDYIQKGKENGINQKWMKELENASARVHINRLQIIKLQVRQEAEFLFQKYGDGVEGHLKKAYSDRFYRTAYEVARGCGVGHHLARIDEGRIRMVLEKPWAQDGANFSDRIWANKVKLVQVLHTELSQHVIRGSDPYQAVQAISKKMDVSKNRASTLVYTESAAIAAAAQRDCFNELDIGEFEIVATLDSLTSDLCRNMDGKHFSMKDYEVGVTAPPFHPNCRSVACPYFDDEFSEGGKRAARGEDGKTHYVLADMTYKEWQRSFVDGGESGLHNAESDGTMKKRLEVKELDKLKQSGMTETEYQEYLYLINRHSNEDVTRLYSEFGDMPSSVVKMADRGAYSSSQKTIKYDMPPQRHMDNGVSKYSTLAHEYGHAFDDLGSFRGLHYNEIDTLNNKVKIGSGALKVFKRVPSSSDEFLVALRKDKEQLRKTFKGARNDILSTGATNGVQDALRGFFGSRNVEVIWGHEESYYNRTFNKFIKGFGKEKEFGEALKELGIDASNSSKRKNACRIYETASETWANIMSAETCQGEELEAVKKYLPNAYAALLEIIGKVGGK